MSAAPKVQASRSSATVVPHAASANLRAAHVPSAPSDMRKLVGKGPLSPADARTLRALQRSAGNRAVAGALAKGSPAVVQREGEGDLPEWAVTSSSNPLPGVRVPGYEEDRPSYNGSDYTQMLFELNKRCQLNGSRLSDFYDELRLAWNDIILDEAAEDAGLSLPVQILINAVTELVTLPMGPAGGAVVGFLTGTITNAVDSVMTERELDARKRRLQELMTAPGPKEAGEGSARAKLARLLVDAVGYASWLGTNDPSSYHLFRIPPEFPEVRRADVRRTLAGAIVSHQAREKYGLRYPSAGERRQGKVAGTDLRRVVHSTVEARNPTYRRNLIFVSILDSPSSVGAAAAPILDTEPRGLRRDLVGRRIGDLKEIPVVATYAASAQSPELKNHAYIYGEEYPQYSKLAIGRDDADNLVWHGQFWALYMAHRYVHECAAPTDEQIHEYSNPNRDGLAWEKRVAAYRRHYLEHMPAAARFIIDNMVNGVALK